MTEQSGSRKLAIIAIVVSILSLIASILFSSYSFLLASQANELTRRSHELQEMLSNFKSVVIAEPEVGFLYSNQFSYENGSIYCVSHYGHLNVSLKVITPHYGKISIEITNFTADPRMLNPNMKNQTTVSYFWEEEKYEDVVVMGLNSLSADLELKAEVYPDPQQLPSSGEKIQFPIGRLHLEARLLDVQTNKTTTEEFYASICVIIIIPW